MSLNKSKDQPRFKISPESITEQCPKCNSNKIVGIHKETIDTWTGKITKEDKMINFSCLDCGHNFRRKRHKFKAKKEAK